MRANDGSSICYAGFIFDRYRTIFPAGVPLFLLADERKAAGADTPMKFVSQMHTPFFFSTRIRNFMVDGSATRRARLSVSGEFVANPSS